MNAFEIAQIANLGITTLFGILSKPDPKKVTKEEVKGYVMTSVQTAEMLGTLIIHDRKGSTKDFNKLVDVIYSIAKSGKVEWKQK